MGQGNRAANRNYDQTTNLGGWTARRAGGLADGRTDDPRGMQAGGRTIGRADGRTVGRAGHVGQHWC